MSNRISQKWLRHSSKRTGRVIGPLTWAGTIASNMQKIKTGKDCKITAHRDRSRLIAGANFVKDCRSIETGLLETKSIL